MMNTPVQQKLFRAEDGDLQCMSYGPQGRCPFAVTPGATTCAKHMGEAQVATIANSAMRSYNLMNWQARTQKFTDDSEIKSIRAEIGITRMALENIMITCKSENDLLIHTGKITMMIEQIRKLVVSCQQLEGQLGITLDKNQVMILGSMIVEVIGRYIKDPEMIKQISLEIGEKILSMSPTTEVQLNER